MDARHNIRFLVFTLAAVSFFGLTTSGQIRPPLGVEAAATLQRGLAAHGSRLASGEITDSISEGKLTYFNAEGPQATFDVTLTRKGTGHVQRVVKQPSGALRQGTDGTRTWDSFGGWFTAAAQGHALQFLESQTVRSVQTLFNHQAEGLAVRHRGKTNGAGVIEGEDRRGRKTSYFIDDKTSIVTKLEFVTGEAKDPFSGKIVPLTDTYVFSDHRMIQGVLTPFKIERYIGGTKAEEMQFTSVRYNASLKDDLFKP
jgi:hypothetical protein